MPSMDSFAASMPERSGFVGSGALAAASRRECRARSLAMASSMRLSAFSLSAAGIGRASTWPCRFWYWAIVPSTWSANVLRVATRSAREAEASSKSASMRWRTTS